MTTIHVQPPPTPIPPGSTASLTASATENLHGPLRIQPRGELGPGWRDAEIRAAGNGRAGVIVYVRNTSRLPLEIPQEQSFTVEQIAPGRFVTPMPALKPLTV